MVTGAGSGIGKGMATGLAEAGANIVIGSRTPCAAFAASISVVSIDVLIASMSCTSTLTPTVLPSSALR